MSWVAENSLTTFQKFCIKVLKCGPIPRHIAFIMDGNRRFAKKQQVEKLEGHSKGFEKLSECLSWCLELGIREVTVYAFSIENFKRSKDEVDQLMELAREKFKNLFKEEQKLMKNGVCIRVIGNLTLLPEDLRKLVAKAMLMTKNNKKAILNVAFSYTSREEITHSINTVVKGCWNGDILVEDINEELISHCLYTNQSPNPEILIRTSGEVRLSDFLLWQANNSQIYFANILWPEFGVWHLLSCVFKYQRNFNAFKESYYQNDHFNSEVNSRVKVFLDKLGDRRFKQLEVYAQS